MSQVSRRSPKLLLMVAGLAIAGCAPMSQVPIVSIAADLQALNRLIASLSDGSASDAELHELVMRPTPPPPGISYEIGTARKAAAAAALADVSAVRDAYRSMRRNSTNADLLFVVAGVTLQAELMQGNMNTVASMCADLEKEGAGRYARGAGGFAGSSDAFINLVGTCMGSALDYDRETARRMLNQYPENIDSAKTASESTKYFYWLKYQMARAHMAMRDGDLERAYSGVRKLRSEVQLRPAPQETSMGTTPRNAAAEQCLRWLTIYSLLLGRQHQARAHLDEYLTFRSNAGKSKGDAQGYFQTEALYYLFAGNPDRALAAWKQAWNSRSFFLRKYRLNNQLMLSDRARIEARAGDFPAAVRTLADPAFAEMEAGLIRDLHVIDRIYASTMSGVSEQDLRPLDAVEESSKRTFELDGLVQLYAVKTIAYQRRAASLGRGQDLVSAVDSGRKFSRTLQQAQAVVSVREVPLDPRMLRAARESYLLAVTAALNRGEATVDDLLDALILGQGSETDADIAAAALRRKEIPGVTPTEMRKLQDLRQAARAAQKDLVACAQSNESDQTKVAVFSAKARAAFSDLDKFLEILQRQAPSLRQAIATRRLSIGEVQTRLGPAEGLVAFAITGNGVVALFVTKSSVQHRVLSLRAKRLSALVKKIRSGVTFGASVEAPDFDLVAARELFGELFGWTQKPLSLVKTLVVIPEGPLATIPFGLLVRSDGGAVGSHDYRSAPWLIKSVAITHAPSIASWLAIGVGRSSNRGNSFVAWADPDFGARSNEGNATTRAIRRSISPVNGTKSDGDSAGRFPADLSRLLPPLPETKQEAEAVARALRAPIADSVYLGTKATRSSVLALSSSGVLALKRVVMFATHGLAPRQLNGLNQPALAMAREASGTDLPLLSLEDVVGLQMSADWVLLSACNTAAADREGGDALSGLARGFFFAGSQSLLVTHWEVESESAAAITVKTMERYAANAGVTRAQALQQTSIELIEARRTPREWSHPAYWAPYALVGNGGR